MLPQIRVGQGFDVHSFAPSRKLILGGVEIPHNEGLLGHSDADVLIHAICDAVLGAFALGDLGKWFPDTSPEFKNADSFELLRSILKAPELKEWTLANVDSTIIAQSPKMAPYIDSMRDNIAKAFSVDISQVSVKATTTEKLGFTGRKEGIASMATVLFYKAD
ncbi:MAG: 2-C-methyl-D-erythritol 2,4-cyclodiphosphate synthase [Lentisphaeraceae bacterium]|nr:2-C-methyl-D-erythritol 2,4-cyclodiphosphate synthase [Lentisphaeraceae bacterium]